MPSLTPDGHFTILEGPMAGVDANGDTFLKKLQAFQLEISEVIADVAGGEETEADFTSASTAMVSVTDLSVTVVSGKEYIFQITLRMNDDHAEGLVLDLDGGSATVSEIWATYKGFDNSFNFVAVTTALATDATSDGFAGVGQVEINGTFTASANGTFMPRFSQKTHTAGTLKVLKGSSISIQEKA